MATRTSTLDLLHSRLMRITITALALLVSCRGVWAQSLVRSQKTIDVSPVGDGAIKQEIILPLQEYQLLKGATSNMSLLLRELGHRRHWYRFDNMNGEFDDMKNRINFNYEHRSLSRPVQSDKWSISLEQYDDLELVAQFDQTLLLTSLMTEGGMIGTMTHRLNLPEGATSIKLDADKHEVTYRYTPDIETSGGREEVSFEIDHKKQLMSCLAKVYSNPDFTFMWAARSTFENTGSVPVTDYRVRFRVGDLGPWSGWKRTATVFPGQMVVDPYFPVFDLAKTSAMNGTRPTQIEVEYRYRRADGEVVTETDAFSTQMLARNQAIFSSLDADQCLNFNDRFNYIPAIVSAMVTPNDPVVQQIVGRVHGKAAAASGNAIAASADTEDAIQLLAAMWAFLQENKITYQTPPSLLVDGHAGQHIKYSRDVIVNRAGTCVDLALMWASVCEAAGLNPVVLVIPGHAFPAVELPNGNLLAWESTMVNNSFEEAVQVGMKRLNELDPETTFQVDIAEMRAAGFQSNELPKVDPGFVDSMGLVFQTAQTRTNSQNNEQTDHRHTPTRYEEPSEPSQAVDEPVSSNLPASAIGCWQFSGRVSGIQTIIRINIYDDASYRGYAWFAGNGQEIELEEFGHCRMDYDAITFVSEDNEVTQHRVNLDSGELRVEVPDLNTTFVLRRR